MNLILFDEPFESIRLNADSWPAQHLRKVLRADVGTLVFVGFVNGPRARAEVISAKSDGSYELKTIATEPAPELLPIELLIGLPRPHTARRILFEAASMGVRAIHFFLAEKSEPSYAESRLWKTDEWRERIIRGTEQAFGTHIPQVKLHPDIQSAMEIQETPSAKIALENYEASGPLGSFPINSNDLVAIAVGPERGWSKAERATFRKNKWQLLHMGPHVLRTETACVAAIAALAPNLSLWRSQTETRI